MSLESKDISQQILLTIPQAAHRLNISRAKLYSLIAKGKGPPVVHLGRSVRVSTISLSQWVQEIEHGQQSV